MNIFSWIAIACLTLAVVRLGYLVVSEIRRRNEVKRAVFEEEQEVWMDWVRETGMHEP